MNEQQPETNRFIEGFQKYLPSIQWFLTIIIAISVFVLSFRDGQTSQAAQIGELRSSVEQVKARQNELKTARDKQIDELKSELVTKQNLQDKFDTLLKLQELTREDVKSLRDEIQRSRNYERTVWQSILLRPIGHSETGGETEMTKKRMAENTPTLFVSPPENTELSTLEEKSR